MTAKLVSELSDVMRAVLERHPINAQRAIDGLSLANVVLLRCRAALPTSAVAADKVIHSHLTEAAAAESTCLRLRRFMI